MNILIDTPLARWLWPSSAPVCQRSADWTTRVQMPSVAKPGAKEGPYVKESEHVQ